MSHGDHSRDPWYVRPRHRPKTSFPHPPRIVRNLSPLLVLNGNELSLTTLSPYVILNDFGGAFAMGAIGGGIWHGIKGARNSPRVGVRGVTCRSAGPSLTGMLLSLSLAIFRQPQLCRILCYPPPCDRCLPRLPRFTRLPRLPCLPRLPGDTRDPRNSPLARQTGRTLRRLPLRHQSPRTSPRRQLWRLGRSVLVV